MEQHLATGGGQTATLVRPPAMGGDGASADISFLHSNSKAQGFHTPPSHQKQPVAPEGPVFRKSNFESQAIVEAEKTQDERKGVVWRFKNAFLKSENQISTWMTVGFIKAWVDKTFGAWGKASPLNVLGEKTGATSFLQNIPKPPGHGAMTTLLYGKNFDKNALSVAASKPPGSSLEKLYAAGVTGALLQNLTFFMTARGGEIPDGETVGQRMLNSLKNPDKHSVHFSNLTMACFIALIGATRIALGMKGYEKAPEGEKKEPVIKIIAGTAGILTAPLVLFGMFKIKKPDGVSTDQESKDAGDKQAQLERDASQMRSGGDDAAKDTKSKSSLIASLKPGHVKEMWQYAWKNDKLGLTGRALSLIIELGFIADGRLTLAKEPTDKSAYSTVKGGVTGLVLNCMQMHFVYDRLLNNSKQEQASPAR